MADEQGAILDPAAVAKFWSRVDVRGSDDCWLWTGSRCRRGYGSFSSAGRTYRTHRLAWMIQHQKEIPAGMCGCHACDNPSCVNPNHIWLGSVIENNFDMIRKKRQKGPPVENATKTHCKYGHEFTPENTMVYDYRPNERGCRTCQNIRNARWRARSSAAKDNHA